MIDTDTLRSKIIDLAIRGKLTNQLKEDGSAEELYEQIQEIKVELVKQGLAKKEKVLGEISEIEIPFEIPANWKWVRLRDICKKIVDGDHNPPAGVKEKTEYLMLSAQNINGDKLVNIGSARYLTEDIFIEENKRTRLEKGDVLLTIVATLGRSCVYRDDLNVCFQRSVCVISSLINPDYLKKYFDSSYIQKFMKDNATGAAQPGFYLNKVERLCIPLPPMNEQKRIVELFELIDNKLRLIEEMQTFYVSDIEVLKCKLISAGIQGKLTKQLPEDGTAEELYADIQEEKAKLIKEKKIKKEKGLAEIAEEEIPFKIPDNWKWVRLGDICSKISPGNTPAGGSKGGAYVTEGFCFLREQNIYNDGIHNDGMVYITEKLLNTRPNSTVLPKDILLNITGGSIGRCALIPDDFSRGSINQHILIIRVVDPRIRFYVHKCLCSPYYQKLIKGNVVGDKDGFSAGRCKNTLLPLPPLSEQNRIVEKLEEILSLV